MKPGRQPWQYGRRLRGGGTATLAPRADMSAVW